MNHTGTTGEPGSRRPDSGQPAKPEKGTSDGAHPTEPAETRELPNVEELTPDSRGTWLVLSANTTHVLDLDRHRYQRRPGPHGSRFPFDFTSVEYSVIEIYPKRGGHMLVWFDDPTAPDLWEHFRRSSTIRAILGPDGDRGRPGLEPAGGADAADPSTAAPTAAFEEFYTHVGKSGRWRVLTENSEYLLDLDARTATRKPRERWPLRADGHPLALLQVLRAQVGEPLTLRLRLDASPQETVRYATVVVRIERL